MKQNLSSIVIASTLALFSYSGQASGQVLPPSKPLPTHIAQAKQNPDFSGMSQEQFRQYMEKQTGRKYSPGLAPLPAQKAEIWELEGKIIKVQPSTISYFGSEQKFMAYRGESGNAMPQSIKSSANHELIYVFLEDKFDNLHLLIQPASRGILEGAATVKYEPLNNGAISANEFVRKYVHQSYGTDDPITLQAEGIIAKDGIAYKRQNKKVFEKPQ